MSKNDLVELCELEIKDYVGTYIGMTNVEEAINLLKTILEELEALAK